MIQIDVQFFPLQRTDVQLVVTNCRSDKNCIIMKEIVYRAFECRAFNRKLTDKQIQFFLWDRGSTLLVRVGGLLNKS